MDLAFSAKEHVRGVRPRFIFMPLAMPGNDENGLAHR